MVKSIFCKSVFVTCALFAVNVSFAQGLPNCASANSDPDGDGYGWENNQSCVVVTSAQNNAANNASRGQCEDHGGFPWGWNPVTSESCRLDAPSSNSSSSSPSTSSPSTSSNRSQIGINIAGNWYCQSQITTSDFFEPRQNRVATINDTVRWVQAGSSSSAGGNGSCEQPSGTRTPSISRYEFGEDRSLTIHNEVSVLTASCPQGEVTSHTFDNTVFADWRYDGQSLTMNGEGINEFGVESKTVTTRSESNPSRSVQVNIQLLNLYMDNANRLSCRNVGSDLTPALLF